MDERKAFEAWYAQEFPHTGSAAHNLGVSLIAWLAWQAATLAERERAAKVCDDAAANSHRNDGLDDAFEGGLHSQAMHLAAAIRNYPNQDKAG